MEIVHRSEMRFFLRKNLFYNPDQKETMDDKKITLKQLAIPLAGVILALFGLLWFLQGIAILTLCPVLCVADCECVTSGSPFWEVIGAITFIIGIAIIFVSLKRIWGETRNITKSKI